MAYLETLAQVLDDGVIDTSEAADLRDLVGALGLRPEVVKRAHAGLIRALALEAWSDGKVTAAERRELSQIAAAIDVATELDAAIKEAQSKTRYRLEAVLEPLPDNWRHGEPARVGDKVAFTGCSDMRDELELQAERAGLRVMSSVSKLTALLVSDGSVDGNKLRAAREMGVRIVSPDLFRTLVAHVQPSVDECATRKLPAKEPEFDPIHRVKVVEDDAASPAAIRAWARSSGYNVGARGRLHADVIAAYHCAHRTGTPAPCPDETVK